MSDFSAKLSGSISPGDSCEIILHSSPHAEGYIYQPLILNINYIAGLPPRSRDMRKRKRAVQMTTPVPPLNIGLFSSLGSLSLSKHWWVLDVVDFRLRDAGAPLILADHVHDGRDMSAAADPGFFLCMGRGC